jgi:hypothetical protein
MEAMMDYWILAALAGCGATVWARDTSGWRWHPGKPQPDPWRPQNEVGKPPPDPWRPGDEAGKPRPDPWQPGDEAGKPQPDPWQPGDVAGKPQPDPWQPITRGLFGALGGIAAWAALDQRFSDDGVGPVVLIAFLGGGVGLTIERTITALRVPRLTASVDNEAS